MARKITFFIGALSAAVVFLFLCWGLAGERRSYLPGKKDISRDYSTLEPPDKNIRVEVAWFKDTSRPLSERKQKISDLACRADKGETYSLEVLMALGSVKAYLNRVAVEELGKVHHAESRPRIVKYLKSKLSSGDALVLCAAVRSLGRLQGGKALPELAGVIKRNRRRHDGCGNMVCATVVKVLGEIGSSESVPTLAAELERAGENAGEGGWNLEYGSEVVASLAGLDDDAARKAIAAYADRIASKLPEDPVARGYVKNRIAEARRAAGGQGWK